MSLGAGYILFSYLGWDLLGLSLLAWSQAGSITMHWTWKSIINSSYILPKKVFKTGACYINFGRYFEPLFGLWYLFTECNFLS